MSCWALPLRQNVKNPFLGVNMFIAIYNKGNLGEVMGYGQTLEDAYSVLVENSQDVFSLKDITWFDAKPINVELCVSPKIESLPNLE